nr:hypothetical protein CFP56_03455 [Quercus suber]
MDKFKKLVEFDEMMNKFIVDYGIPNNVSLKYCEEGEWYIRRRGGEVVIPIVAFVEGGMRIPMRPVTLNYLRHFRLALIQCAVNVFRILGCVDTLNEKMGLRLTHHDVNWCYNLHHLRGKTYYMKTRDDRVRLIQCLPDSNKGLTQDFLIVSGEWHNGFHCPTIEGEPDPHAFARHFHLVNKADLKTVLRSDLFLNETDNQVRAAYQILGCDPAQKSFPVPKHIIRAHDPRLTQITVVKDGFAFTEGSYIPEGIPLAGPSSSQQVTVAEEGLSKKAREVVELSSSEDEYSVFNLADQSEDPSGDLGDPHLSEADLRSLRVGTPTEMGLKRQPQTNLLDLLEGGSKKSVPEESQPQPPAPQPQILTVQTRSSSVPIVSDLQTESHDPKRKRLSKGKEPMDGSKSHSPPEEGRFCRPSKQLKLSGQRKGKKAIQQSEAQTWLPAAMLHDQPLMDNASMRESQGAEGAPVADALEKSLLLPADMAELRNMSGSEVVLDLKKYLGMAIQALFRLGEEVDDHSNTLAQERDKFLEAANTLKRSETDLKKATEDLEEMTKARDTAVSDLAVARKQAEDQTNRLQDVEGQLQTAKENIVYMKEKLTVAIHEKGVAEYARDEAVRAKDEVALLFSDLA